MSKLCGPLLSYARFAHILEKKIKGKKTKQIMDQTSKEDPNIAAQNLFVFSNPHSRPSYSTIMYKSSGYVLQLLNSDRGAELDLYNPESANKGLVEVNFKSYLDSV